MSRRSHAAVWQRIGLAGVAALAVVGLVAPAAAAAKPTAPPPPARSEPAVVAPPAGMRPVSPPIVPAPTAGPRPATATAPPPVTEAAALSQARATGRPVDITGDTTETRQVFANPNGTFSMHSTVRPVRVRRNGAWVPVDATLRPNADGSLSPVASTVDTAFSGGGAAPLVRLTAPSGSVALYWPAGLPTPTVSGPTATYPGVLPGVDLRMTAEQDGYREVLVVRDATAATNPALAHLHLTAVGTGLTVRPGGNGDLVAAAPDGTPAFYSGSSMTWDSHYDARIGGMPSADDPGSGITTPIAVAANPLSAQQVAGVSSSRTDIVVSPDPAALTGPNVKYPVYVDPQMISTPSQNWLVVSSGPTREVEFDNSFPAGQVGLCDSSIDSSCNNIGAARTFFQMNTAAIAGHNGTVAHIWNAQVFVTQTHNYSSAATLVDLEVGTSAPTLWSMGWGGPPFTYVDQTSASGAGRIEFGNAGQVAQTAVNNGWSSIVIGLVAPYENDMTYWKKFELDNPELDVTYSYPPSPAYNPNVSRQVTCTGRVYTPDSRPTLFASAVDNNWTPLNPHLWFHVSNNGGASDLTGGGPAIVASGTQGGWTVPNPLADGDYNFRVWVDNNPENPSQNLAAGYNAWFPFTVLGTPPAAVPTIGSWDYPSGYWGEPTDSPGAIALYANGASNIAGFTWTLQGAGAEPVPTTAECNYNQTFSSGGTVTGGYIAVTPSGSAILGLPAGLSVGYHTMYVRTFDFAHNLSPESQPYTFYVAAPAGGAPTWAEAETLTTSQPAGQNVALGPQANCCGVSWSGGQQLVFQGTAANQSFSVQFNAPTAGNYEMAANLTTAPDYGIVTMAIDGKPVTINGNAQFDGYTTSVATRYSDLGTAYLTKGTHTLTETVVGTNPATTGLRYMAGIDYLVYRPSNHLDAESALSVQPILPPNQTVNAVVEPNDNGQLWRGGAQLLYPATAAGQSIRLAFTAPVEADYGLAAMLTRKSNYGQLSFSLDDQTVLANTASNPFEGYAATEQATYLPLGGAHLTAGQHWITVTVTGHNASSTGFQAGVQFITAAAVNNVTASSFTAAMNNHGIVDDNVGGGSLDMVGNALSAQAMAAAGAAPGSKYTTSGATFTIPMEGSATTNDNVIAEGQTIPLDAGQQVNASAVGLLVTATCGWTPEAPAAITYDTGPITNPRMPIVADWVNGDNDSATIVMPHADNAKGVPPGNTQARLYAIFLPTDPTRKLKSITLPYTGAQQLPNNCRVGAGTPAALHVFAIAARPVTGGAAPGGEIWLGAWSAPVDAAALPPGGAPLSGDTFRTVVHPTATGDSVRVRLSNLDTQAPITVDATTIAAQSGTGAATLAAPTPLTFGGATSVTIPVGGEIDSDAVASPSTTGGTGDLLVSMHLPSVTRLPVHTTRTNATYLSAENDTANQTGTPFTTAVPGDYLLTGVDVSATDTTAGTIAVVGDQLSTTGATGGTCDGNTGYACTWVDDLAAGGAGQLPGSVVNASRAGTPAQDQWQLTDGTGTTAADTGGTHPATATGGVTWSTAWAGDVAGSANFDGGTGYLATSGPVVDTTTNFTISAWVNPRQLGSAWQTFVVQQAGTGSGFYLEYDGTTGHWSFSRVATDTVNPTIDRAESSGVAVANTWTHLVGTYSPGASQMVLYVNGSASGFVVDATPIASTGPLVIGRGFRNGGPDDFTTGAISDVQLYQRTLDPLEVANIWDAPPSQQVRPAAGVPSAYSLGVTYNTSETAMPTTPSVALNTTLGSLPNLRTVVVAVGADDVLNDEPASLIEQNLTAIIGPSRALGMKNLYRPDGTLVRVILTTVPPLGLAAGDPRESIREQLNADILKNDVNYGADGVVDFDQAVAGTTAGQLAANLVTNGLPNATYYSDLANAILNAIAFPPKIQL